MDPSFQAVCGFNNGCIDYCLSFCSPLVKEESLLPEDERVKKCGCKTISKVGSVFALITGVGMAGAGIALIAAGQRDGPALLAGGIALAIIGGCSFHVQSQFSNC